MSWRFVGAALLLALAALATLAGWQLRDVTTVAPTQTGTLPLSASRPLAQYFEGSYSGLHGVDLLIEPPAGWASGGGPDLVLELYGDAGALLRAASARPATGGRNWLPFRFTEMPASRGERYVFRLLAPDVAFRDGLLIWQSARPLPGHGRMAIADTMLDGALVYRPHYRPSALELLAVYTRRLAEARGDALAFPALYGGLVLLYLLALAALAVLLVRFVGSHLGDRPASLDD
ncbi:MAG: hypothetical protein HY691_10725 [Chloroflexi bacterium]|nr:hypothetical protein [Chloroflexota bacterium]